MLLLLLCIPMQVPISTIFFVCYNRKPSCAVQYWLTVPDNTLYEQFIFRFFANFTPLTLNHEKKSSQSALEINRSNDILVESFLSQQG